MQRRSSNRIQSLSYPLWCVIANMLRSYYRMGLRRQYRRLSHHEQEKPNAYGERASGSRSMRLDMTSFYHCCTYRGTRPQCDPQAYSSKYIVPSRFHSRYSDHDKSSGSDAYLLKTSSKTGHNISNLVRALPRSTQVLKMV